MEVIFAHNRERVADDPRFEVIRINENLVQVTAPQGLRGMDDTIVE